MSYAKLDKNWLEETTKYSNMINEVNPEEHTYAIYRESDVNLEVIEVDNFNKNIDILFSRSIDVMI